MPGCRRRVHRPTTRARSRRRRRSTRWSTRPLLATRQVRYVGEPLAVVLTERPRDQGEDAAELIVVDYDPLAGGRRPRGGADRHDAPLPERRRATSCSTTAMLGMPGLTGDELLRRLRGRRERADRQPARRPLPARGPRRGGGLGGRPARASGCPRSTPTAPATPWRPPTGSTKDERPRHRPRRRRRLRRQDRRLPRGAAARPPRQGGRPARALARDPQREHARPRPRPGPGAATSRSAAPATARCWPTASTSSRTPAPSPRWAPILAPFMTRPMAPGVYAIPEDRVHRRRRSSPTPRRPSPTAAPGGPRPPPPSSGRWTCSPPRSAWTRSRCGAATSSPAFDEPYTTVIGQTYDVGDYEGALDRVLGGGRLRPSCGPSRRRRRAAGDPVQLGIGVSCYVEITGGVPPFGEEAKIEVKRRRLAPSSTPAPRRTARATSRRGR